MPIRPENRARYPATWGEIRADVLRRAHNRCEWDDCGAVNHAVGYWRKGAFAPLPPRLREAGYEAGDIVACANGEALKLIRIVLTIAHLDHTPENCDLSNLRAWCQRHHLGYDAPHHAETAYATRRQGRAVADLFAAA